MRINSFDYTVEIKQNDKVVMSKTLNIKTDSWKLFKDIINHGEILINNNESFFFHLQRGFINVRKEISTPEELVEAVQTFCIDFVAQQEIAQIEEVSLVQQLINAISEKVLQTTPIVLTEDEEENIDTILDFFSDDFSALGEPSTLDGAFDAYLKIVHGGDNTE
jgi:hypothetical protein